MAEAGEKDVSGEAFDSMDLTMPSTSVGILALRREMTIAKHEMRKLGYRKCGVTLNTRREMQIRPVLEIVITTSKHLPHQTEHDLCSKGDSIPEDKRLEL